MAIRDKTISQGMIDFDLVNQRLNEQDIKIDLLTTGIIPKGIFDTYAIMLTQIGIPEDGWLVIIESDETHSNSQTQYFYYENDWIFLGGMSNINDSSSDIKGVLRLNGDLTGTAMYPQLKEVFPMGSNYSIAGNVVTISKKGLITNINITNKTEWTKIFPSNSVDRIINTDTFTVPSYDLINSELVVLFCGNELIENRDWERINETTIKTKFIVRPEDDLVVKNIKYQGYLDVSSIVNDVAESDITTYSSQKSNQTYYRNDNDLIPTVDATYDLGTPDIRFSNIYAQTGTIQTSDIRYKTNIEQCDLGVEFIKKLNPISYNYIDRTRRHYGLSAQSLEEVLDGKDFGGLVYDKKADMYGIRYEELIPILINGIKQQQLDIEYLKLSMWKKFVLKIKSFINKKNENEK